MSTEAEFDVTGELSENGEFLVIEHFKMLRRVYGHLKGEKLRIRFSKLRMKRSDAQNRFLWGVVVPTVRAFLLETEGVKYSPDEVYLWLRVKLLGQSPVIKVVSGIEVVMMEGKRFSEMNTKEFAEATDTILQSMAEVGCVIPEPQQHNFLHEFI